MVSLDGQFETIISQIWIEILADWYFCLSSVYFEHIYLLSHPSINLIFGQKIPTVKLFCTWSVWWYVRFLCVFAVAFLLFLTPAGGSYMMDQFSNPKYSTGCLKISPTLLNTPWSYIQFFFTWKENPESSMFCLSCLQ